MGTRPENVSDNPWPEWAQTWPPSGTAELPKPPDTQLQQPEQLNCPRCGSTNTKFCYYNNYNRSQPRHRCKSCKRYWTKGGTLRNVPVGGARRKHNRPRICATTAAPATDQPRQQSRQNYTLINNIATDQQNMSDILYQALNASITAQNPNTRFFPSMTDPSSYQPVFDTNYWRNWNEVDGSQEKNQLDFDQAFN